MRVCRIHLQGWSGWNLNFVDAHWHCHRVSEIFVSVQNTGARAVLTDVFDGGRLDGLGRLRPRTAPTLLNVPCVVENFAD
jgi:hypothetical protein